MFSLVFFTSRLSHTHHFITVLLPPLSSINCLQAKAAAAAADKVQEEVAQLKRLKGRLAEMEAAAARSSLPLTPGGQVDFSQDFFGEKVFLTVSGQLNGEGLRLIMACCCCCCLLL
jgi:hypothetical protein